MINLHLINELAGFGVIITTFGDGFFIIIFLLIDKMLDKQQIFLEEVK